MCKIKFLISFLKLNLLVSLILPLCISADEIPSHVSSLINILRSDTSQQSNNSDPSLPPGNYKEYCRNCYTWKAPRMLGPLTIGENDMLTCECFRIWIRGHGRSLWDHGWEDNPQTIDYGSCPGNRVTTKINQLKSNISWRTKYWMELKCAD